MNISNKVLLSRNNMKHEVVSVSFLYSLWNKKSIFFFALTMQLTMAKQTAQCVVMKVA